MVESIHGNEDQKRRNKEYINFKATSSLLGLIMLFSKNSLCDCLNLIEKTRENNYQISLAVVLINDVIHI
jgi:hypothetical protein